MKEKLIESHPELHLQSIMMNSGVGDEIDSMYVADVILRYLKECRANVSGPIKNPRAMILPQLHRRLEKKETDMCFAEKAFITIGLFREHLEWLTKFRGHPRYKIYGDTSKQIYFDYGRKGISQKFYEWTDFLHNCLELKDKDSQEIRISKDYTRTRYHRSFPDFRQWKRAGYLE